MYLQSNCTYVPLPLRARVAAGLVDLLAFVAVSPIAIVACDAALGASLVQCFQRPAVAASLGLGLTAYVLVFWRVALATPGKMSVRAIIVDAKTGANPSLSQWLKRYLALIVSCAALGFGFIPAAFSAAHQTFHDRIAGTLVVREREMKSHRQGRDAHVYLIAALALAGFAALLYLLTALPGQPESSLEALVEAPPAFLADDAFQAVCLSGAPETPVDDEKRLAKHLESARANIDNARGRRSALEVARSALNTALSMDPCHPGAYREYARYFLRISQIQDASDAAPGDGLADAQRSLSRALALDPRYAEAYVLQGFLFHLAGEPRLATEALARAQSLGSTDPWLYINRALVKRDAGDYQGAATDYRRAMEADGADKNAIGVAMEGIADYFQRIGALPQADEVYAKRVAFDPDAVLGHLKYARFLLCDLDDTERALRELNLTANLAKNTPYVQYGDVMAANHARQWARHIHRGGLAAQRMAPKHLHLASTFADGTPLDMIAAVCHSGPAYEQVRTAFLASPTGDSAQPPDASAANAAAPPAISTR